MDQKSIEKWIKKVFDFLIDFLSIFGRFLVDFGAQVGPKIDQKSVKNRTKIGIENIAKKWQQKFTQQCATRAAVSYTHLRAHET